MLGRGGMGEVYRADDLKLGQPVALKFLPQAFGANGEKIRRLLDEVRTARQVSHPNVCRIYDVGESDGQHFLTMEFIDGEDLASLLRRIGHLPKTKAIQIARQLCAGLAAAHDAGVLHRDLKPSNVMIDGRGRARLTDFGLAALAGSISADDRLAGTPAYMAPEQLAGREVSARSDLYALGLVMYELFTGRPAFKARTLDEARRQRSESAPSNPSSLVEGFDPAVERVIMRCLESDPAARPASVRAVAASLPGGDPLAAALAAGETPSPELVAAAGDEPAAAPGLAWGALTLFVVALAGVVALSPLTTLPGSVPLDKPPEVLRERAREILARAGYDRKPADHLFAFEANRDYLEELARRDRAGSPAWEDLGASPPAAIQFWYRAAPQPLTKTNPGIVGDWLSDPPDDQPDMARVGLDPDGRLMTFSVVPGERTASTPPAPETDWTPFLEATGVDSGSLAPASPEWTPPVFADRRAAWTGSWPGRPELPVRVEAASNGGRPVWLRVILPWTRPAEESPPQGGLGNKISWLVRALWPPTVIVVAALVALRNVRGGRGDRRGALRFALFLGALRFTWFLGAHHVMSPFESVAFEYHLAMAVWTVGMAYVFYLALEPYARRLWPRMLVSWVRLLDGRWRDPLVGRDLLIGSAAGALIALTGRLSNFLPALFGAPRAMPLPAPWTFEPLRGTLSALVAFVGIFTAALQEVIFPVTSVLIFRLLLRRTDLAFAAAGLVGILLFYPDSGSIPAYFARMLVLFGIAWLVLSHAGLLAFATMFSVMRLIGQIPLTPHPAEWYSGTMLLSLAILAAPAVYGFWIARARGLRTVPETTVAS